MNLNFETKPKVKICLIPVLEAYCRYVFETPPDQDVIVLNQRRDIGLFIPSHIQISELPVHRPFHPNQVTFILPVTKSNHYALKYRFFHVSTWAEEKIQNFIEAEFKQWVRLKFEYGYEKKLSQEEIIDAILRGLNVRNSAVNFDTIKKIDYRNRRLKERKRFEMLLNN
ncbi:MAG: hypothetical protein PF489_13510 [Salinivirgaceae bacterium]|jgi:hypothetical protein|nr:hypothetical protein [Salinivirgaceae bacterium]